MKKKSSSLKVKRTKTVKARIEDPRTRRLTAKGLLYWSWEYRRRREKGKEQIYDKIMIFCGFNIFLLHKCNFI